MAPRAAGAAAVGAAAVRVGFALRDEDGSVWIAGALVVGGAALVLALRAEAEVESEGAGLVLREEDVSAVTTEADRADVDGSAAPPASVERAVVAVLLLLLLVITDRLVTGADTWGGPAPAEVSDAMAKMVVGTSAATVTAASAVA